MFDEVSGASITKSCVLALEEVLSSDRDLGKLYFCTIKDNITYRLLSLPLFSLLKEKMAAENCPVSQHQ